MAASTGSGAGDASIFTPKVEWAQRKDKVLLTVFVEDCKDEKISVQENSFSFSGKGGKEKKEYAVNLEFFGEIDASKWEQKNFGRNFYFSLTKKDTTAPFWPRLTKGTQKLHFLKTDFGRWRDEDDSEEEEKEDYNLEEMMNSMGGLNGMGGMGAGGMGMGMEGLDGVPQADSDDSDDGELPDLQ